MEVAPRKWASLEVAPRKSASSEVVPRKSAPREGAPREGAPRERAPRERAPREGAPREGAPLGPANIIRHGQCQLGIDNDSDISMTTFQENFVSLSITMSSRNVIFQTGEITVANVAATAIAATATAEGAPIDEKGWSRTERKLSAGWKQRDGRHTANEMSGTGNKTI